MITNYNDGRGVEELFNLSNEQAAEELRKKAMEIERIRSLSFFRQVPVEDAGNRHERRKQAAVDRKANG